MWNPVKGVSADPCRKSVRVTLGYATAAHELFPTALQIACPKTVLAAGACEHIVKPCPAERVFSQSPAERAFVVLWFTQHVLMNSLRKQIALPTMIINAITACEHILKPCPAERAFPQSPAERAFV